MHANANSPTELYILSFLASFRCYHLINCSLLLNSCLIKVDFKPFDSWGYFVPDISFEIVDKLR